MDEFKYRTRRQRGCDIFGRKPQHHVALYNDNCSSHSIDKQIKRLIERDNVHTRPLIKNATHVQQMVDQHVGVTLKKDIKKQYREYTELLFDEVDQGKRDPDDKVSAQMKRSKIFEFAYKASLRLKEKKHLLRSSYINFGINLSLIGSQDDDISTLHVDGRYKINDEQKNDT